MKDKLDILTNSSVVVGTALGLTITINDIYNLLGIILLIFQIVIIVMQGVIKLNDAIKAKDAEEANKVLDEVKEKFDKIKGDNEDDNNNP